MIGPLLAAAAVFAPPPDTPYRLTIHEERVQGGVTRRYELERRVVFHRDGGDWLVEMTLVRVWQDVGGETGRRFEAAAGALKGRTLRFHLAADGAVRSIDDEAGAWQATVAGIAAAASADPAQRAAPGATLAHDPTAALAALPVVRRRAMLAMPFASLMVGDEPLTPGSGPVTLPSGIVAGQSLAGTRSVAVGADARLHITVHAAGADAAAPVSLDREQVVDPVSGLVVDERETQTSGRDDAAQIRRQHVTFDPWYGDTRRQ